MIVGLDGRLLEVVVSLNPVSGTLNTKPAFGHIFASLLCTPPSAQTPKPLLSLAHPSPLRRDRLTPKDTWHDG